MKLEKNLNFGFLAQVIDAKILVNIETDLRYFYPHFPEVLPKIYSISLKQLKMLKIMLLISFSKTTKY